MMKKPVTQMPLRVPQTLHEELKVLADAEGVSLNQYCLYILSRNKTAPEGYASKKLESLLQFVAEAQDFQRQLNPKALAYKEIPPKETPLQRYRRLHAQV